MCVDRFFYVPSCNRDEKNSGESFFRVLGKNIRTPRKLPPVVYFEVGLLFSPVNTGTIRSQTFDALRQEIAVEREREKAPPCVRL